MDAKTMKLRIEQWMPIFEEQAKSGMGKNEWIKANGIRRWEFYKRQRECRQYLMEMGETNHSFPTFFELPMVSEPLAPSDAVQLPESQPIDIPGQIDVSCGKFRIRIDGKVDETTLLSLVKAVANV